MLGKDTSWMSPTASMASGEMEMEGKGSRARRTSKDGRAMRWPRSYRIPQEERDLGAIAACAMWLAGWCLLWSVETGLIPCLW